MYSDRRQQPRKVPKGFAFIQVERDDGGRVLNISEEGLCFEVFSTLHASQSLRFWFTFDLRERIEALGRLVWMDATTGIGGLSFTSLSQSARDRIRTWVGSLATDEDAIERPVLAPPQVLREPVLRAETVVRAVEPKPVRPLDWPTPSLETISFNSANAALRSAPPTVESHSEYPNATELVPLERHRSVTRTYFMRGLVVGIIVPTAAAALFFRYADVAQHSLASPGPSVQAAAAAPEPEAQTTPQTVQAKTQLATASFAPSYPAKSQHLSPSNHSSDGPFAGPAAKYNVPSSVAPSRATVTPDSTNASRTPAAKKTSATPTQLWAQVHSGSSKAAVELAERYIQGNGVPLNCDQARILLLVASEKNNKEAIQRLRDLDKTGCPVPQS